MSRTFPIIEVRDLNVTFRLGWKMRMHAVTGVSFHIADGETLGLVGESGCGKTTVARTLVGLQTASAGSIYFDGIELLGIRGRKLKAIRPDIQMIFQDAAASLNPGRRVDRTVAEPLRVLGRGDRRQRMAVARALLAEVGIDPDIAAARRPYEFSIGQCQRIAIARSLITEPRLLVCDEPVSSLDVSVQAQILNLLREIKSRRDLTILFISHDLSVIRNICDRVAVMYRGRICETAPVEELFRRPRHPYTAALIAAVPSMNPRPPTSRRIGSKNTFSNKSDLPSGCRYHPRCRQSQPRCKDIPPPLEPGDSGSEIACHFPLP